MALTNAERQRRKRLRDAARRLRAGVGGEVLCGKAFSFRTGGADFLFRTRIKIQDLQVRAGGAIAHRVNRNWPTTGGSLA